MKLKIELEQGDSYDKAGEIASQISKALDIPLEKFIGSIDEKEMVVQL